MTTLTDRVVGWAGAGFLLSPRLNICWFLTVCMRHAAVVHKFFNFFFVSWLKKSIFRSTEVIRAYKWVILHTFTKEAQSPISIHLYNNRIINHYSGSASRLIANFLATFLAVAVLLFSTMTWCKSYGDGLRSKTELILCWTKRKIPCLYIR